MLSGVRVGVTVAVACACTSAAQPLPPIIDSGVIFSYPADGQLDVPLGAPIIVTFSDPVVAAALTPCVVSGASVTGAFCVVGPDGPIDAAVEVVNAGNTLQVSGAALAPGSVYEVFVRSALAPTAANLPATGPLFRFTSRATRSRAAAPALVAINGAAPTAPASARPVFESSTIRLVFSEPLDPRTVTLAPGSIELIDTASETPVPATLFASGIHVSIDPSTDLAAGSSYELRIGSLLADLGGQPATPASIALTPQRAGASAPIPQVLRTRLPGDRGPPRTGTRNVIAIDKPLIGKETSQVQPSALVAELGDPTIDGPLAFTLRRGQRLQASGLNVKLGGELPLGLSTGDITIELVTDGNGRIYRNPFHPAGQRPDNDRSPLAVDLSLDLAIYAADATGNATLTQSVLGVQGSGTVIATDGVLDIDAVIAIDLDLLGVAQAPANLMLELITDPAAKPPADATPPQLIASLPDTGGELAVDAAIELIFSEPIDLAAARAGAIRLETVPADDTMPGEPVEGTLDSQGAAIVIRPAAPLAYATSYRVVLTGVTDVAGNALTDAPPPAFSTPPLLATTAPLTVAAVHPGVPCSLTAATDNTPGRCASGADGDELYQPFSLAANERIEVRFTQPPVPASITRGTACNAGSVRIEQLDDSGACTTAVAGTLLQRERSLSFIPDVPWQIGTHYRLTLISGSNASCADGEVCGIATKPASFDPLAGNAEDDPGGPDLIIDFAGAPATTATPIVTETSPFTDINGSGFVDAGEHRRDDNRVALRITGTTGSIQSASFQTADCIAATPENDACMYLSGAMPVELLPVSHSCPLPDGTSATSCVPVVLSPQAMYATSIPLVAAVGRGSLHINIDTVTDRLVMRIREPAAGPVTGYIIDDNGTPTLVVSLDVYLDAPDMDVVLDHDLHSKPLSIALRGPLRFLPDGRIAITVASVADVPLAVNIDGLGLSGAVNMLIPAGELKLRLVSPPLRGGLR